jgi:hypothetical protein
MELDRASKLIILGLSKLVQGRLPTPPPREFQPRRGFRSPSRPLNSTNFVVVAHR